MANHLTNAENRSLNDWALGSRDYGLQVHEVGVFYSIFIRLAADYVFFLRKSCIGLS